MRGSLVDAVWCYRCATCVVRSRQPSQSPQPAWAGTTTLGPQLVHTPDEGQGFCATAGDDHRVFQGLQDGVVDGGAHKDEGQRCRQGRVTEGPVGKAIG